ncbi:hypothetical protein PIROE2DRAFT_16273 [Piromyces sp. E2]|nr:hypothetical protein PIROE2DRAFT_16273 [Piromyces sp. E2]|eukprot:OUM58443.1 hypothetical protein PIROE2DRAFT_16273 [Piromyces sp. E2]
MTDEEKNKQKNELNDIIGISTFANSTNFSFYKQLDDYERQFYDIIYSKSSKVFPELEIDILITGITIDLQTYYDKMKFLLEKIFTVLIYENPELWWIGDIILEGVAGDEPNSLIITFRMISPESEFSEYSKEQISYINQEIKNEGEKIMNNIKNFGLTTNYAILRYIHDYLVTKNVYTVDNSLKHIRTLYGGLVEGKCTCEGYAEAFQYLARQYNINCIISRSNSHEWNFVEMKGKWYIVDVSYDDPVIEDMDLSSGKNDNLQLDYFLTGTEHISQVNYPKYSEDVAHTLVYTAYGSDKKLITYPTIEKDDYIPSEEEKKELDLIDFSFKNINDSIINNEYTTINTLLWKELSNNYCLKDEMTCIKDIIDI